jgi:hypothetical protein
MTETSAAATDVNEFMTDLDGGRLEHALSVALSQVSASVVDNDRNGEVSIKMKFSKIKGTTQVRCEHTLKFSRPTMNGTASEEETRSTVLHVGKYGALSLAQPSLLDTKQTSLLQPSKDQQNG